jgi:hypothetical protein
VFSWGSFRRSVVRFRSPLLASVLLGLTAFLLWRLAGYLPLERWLVFRYIGYWALSVGVVLASTVFGYAAVVRAVGRAWSVPERLVLATAVGVVTFGLGWYVLAFLHLLGTTAFFLWPVVLCAVGVPTVWRERKRLWLFAARARRLQRGLRTVEVALLLVGFAGLLLAYGANLTPHNVAFDARWYHLPLAERYALEGGIVRFPEGWFLAGYPHLASILYSWCFCLPSALTFDRVELCLHLEFVLFLATLASIGVLSRVVAPRGRPLPRFGAAMIFLFPEFFLYDSSLNGGADHVAAFWAPALFLVTRRVWRGFTSGSLALLAVVVSAILLTKYTAYGLLFGPAVGLFGRLMWLMVTRLRAKRAVLPVLVRCSAVLGAIILLTAPHWLKNLVHYDNPFFPMASDWFPSRPWTSSASDRLFSMYGGIWTPGHDWEGVKETLAQPFVFAFSPRDWPTFHRDWPMFGFLFTLLTPVLLFQRTRALLGLFAVANLGVMFWFWTYHQDRYLQAYLPWMTAAAWVAAVIAARLGIWSRVATVLLLLVQFAWGADAPFFGSHALVGQPLRSSLDHLAAGFNGYSNEKRLVAYGDMELLRQALPKGARVLRHENQAHLGLGAASVADWFQSGIDYTEAPSPAGVHDLLRRMGVTHLVFASGARGFNSVGMDVLFFDYVQRHASKAKRVGGLSLATLAATRPTDAELQVLYAGCAPPYEPGVYGVGQLNLLPHAPPGPVTAPRPRKGSANNLTKALSGVDAVVWGERCHKLAKRPTEQGFVVAAKRGEDTIFVKRR